jgi:HAD superfamily hydrolase (TIGR01509 family)
MRYNSVIFDMDGLLIDSEPLWQEAGQEVLSLYNIQLTDEQYHSSTGLRTPEWIDYWFSYHQIDKLKAPEAIGHIEETALQKIRDSGRIMPGVGYIIDFFRQRDFRIGIASSSPMRLINVVVDKLNIRSYLHAITSAESLAYGKPHPQVFITCAEELSVPPNQCIVFEDSFNGLIAAKAAKMKCVVVPHHSVYNSPRWNAADLISKSLHDFDESKMDML